MALDLPDVVQRIIVKSDADNAIKKLQASLIDVAKQADSTSRSTDKTTDSVANLGDESNKSAPKVAKVADAVDDVGDAARKAAPNVDKHASAVRKVGDEHDRANKKTRPFVGALDQMIDRLQLSRVGFAALGGAIGFLKLPAMIAAIGPAIQALSALGASAVAVTGSIISIGGALAAVPTFIVGFATAAAAGMIATRGIGDAFKASEKGGVEFLKALNNLSPAARDFVVQAKSMGGQMKQIRMEVQEDLFSSLNDALERSRLLLPTVTAGLRDMAKVLGSNAKLFAESLTTDQAIADIAKLQSSGVKVFDNLARSAVRFFEALRNVAVVATPLAEWLGKLIEQGSIYVKVSSDMARENGRLAGFFDRVRENAENLGRILGGMGSLIKSVFAAGGPTGDSMLERAADAVTRLAEKARSFEGQSALARWFDSARAPMTEVWGLVKDIVAVFAEFGTGEQGFTGLVKQLRSEFVPILEKIVHSVSDQLLPALVNMAAAFGRVFADLAGTSGPLFVFITVLTKIAEAIGFLVEKVPGVKELVIVFGALGAAMKALNVAGWVTGISSIGRAVSSVDAGKVGIFGTLARSMVRTGEGATTAGAGFVKLAGGMTAINPLTIGLVGATAAIGAGFAIWRNAQDAVQARVKEFKAALSGSNDEIERQVDAVTDAAFATAGLMRAMNDIGTTSAAVRPAIQGTLTAWNEFADASKGRQKALEDEADALQVANGGMMGERAQALRAEAASLEKVREKAWDYREALSEAARDQINHTVALAEGNSALLITAVRTEQGALAADELSRALSDGSVSAEELRNSQIDLDGAAQSAIRAMRQQTAETDILSTAQAGVFDQLRALIGVQVEVNGTYAQNAQQLGELAVQTGNLSQAQWESIQAQTTAKDGSIDYEERTRLVADAINEAAEAERNRRTALEESRQAMENYNDTLLSQYNADLAVLRGKQQVKDATTAYHEAMAVAGADIDAQNLAAAEYADVAARQVQSMIKAAEQQRILGNETRSSAQIQRDSLLAVAATVEDPVRSQLQLLAANIKDLPTDVNILVAADGVNVTEAALQTIEQAVKDIPGKKEIVSSVPNADGTVTHLVNIYDAQGNIKDTVKITTTASGNAIQNLDTTASKVKNLDGQTATVTVNANVTAAQNAINNFLATASNRAVSIAIRATVALAGMPGARGGTMGKDFTDLLPKMASGGTIQSAGGGFAISRPVAIVGEGSKHHPEYVIPTDPKYRERALGLFADLSVSLGAVSDSIGMATSVASKAPVATPGPSAVAGGAVTIGTVNNYTDTDGEVFLQRLGLQLVGARP